MQDRYESRPTGFKPPRALPLPLGRPAAGERLAEAAEVEREKARRALVYADMVRRAGRILWGELAAWDYQPTEAEVTESIEAARESGATGGRAYYRKKAAADAQAGRKAS